MKRRTLLLGGALLPLGHGGAAQQAGETPPQTAQELRQSPDLAALLADLGLAPGDAFWR